MEAHTDQDPDARQVPSWIAAALGLLCVLLLGLGIPYSDLVMQGTWVGLTAFPISSLFLLFVLVVINAVLRRIGKGLDAGGAASSADPHPNPLPVGEGAGSPSTPLPLGEVARRAGEGAPRADDGFSGRSGSRVAPGLTTGGLLLIYCMMLVAAGLPSFGLTGLLIPYIAGPFYFASAENRYADVLHPYLPEWLHPRSEKAITGLYEGLRPGEPIPWGEWVGPLLYWSLLAGAVYLVFFGLSAILRRRWVDEEKLVFPLVQLPVSLAQYELGSKGAFPSLLRNPLVWGFFAVPFAIHTLNGIHHHYPLIPAINVHLFSLDSYLTSKPWTALSPFWIRFLFSIIALAYLLPQELSFSLWVFYFFFLVQQVVGEALGQPMPAVQAYPVRAFVAHQMIGGIIVYALGNLWAGCRGHSKPWRPGVAAAPLGSRRAGFGAATPPGRLHLKHVWAQAWRRATCRAGLPPFDSAQGRRPARRGVEPAPYSTQDEPMPYGLALGGVVAGFAAICLWGSSAGATVWATALLFALYFLVHLVAVRLVCDGGMLYVQHPFRPMNMLLAAAGSRVFGPQRLAILVLFDHLFMLDNRSPLMPQIMQGHKIGQLVGLPQPKLTALMAGSVALSVLCSYGSYLRLMYRHGGTALHQWFTTYYTKNLYCTWTAHLITTGEPAAPLAFVTMAGGGLSMLVIMYMHHTFLWWPLHPIGYLMGASWPMINFWFPIFVGWLMKTTILWVGSAKLYRKLIPAFLGLILAEFVSAGLWVIIDFAAGVRGHEIFSF